MRYHAKIPYCHVLANSHYYHLLIIIFIFKSVTWKANAKPKNPELSAISSIRSSPCL